MMNDAFSSLTDYFRVLSLLLRVALLRENYPFSVTSWWRTVKRNDAVGGLPKSLHLRGLAIDVVLDPEVNQVDFRIAAEKVGIYVYDEGDHLHLYER